MPTTIMHIKRIVKKTGAPADMLGLSSFDRQAKNRTVKTGVIVKTPTGKKALCRKKTDNPGEKVVSNSL